ncbi:MAG: response regulator [Bryobacterales bacterium]|nr:response regulator [Bryobacterales bacterium]
MSALVAIAGSYVVYRSHQKALAKEALAKIETSTAERVLLVDQRFRRLGEEVRFLAGTPPLDGIARARALSADHRTSASGDDEQAWKRRLQIIFRSLMQGRPEYSQIRLIDSASGLELVRVDRVGSSGIEVVNGDSLQRKSDHDYVIKALLLGPNQVFFSEVTLNREYGRPSLPWEPTIRAATPVAGVDGEPFGVLVINQNLSTLFGELSQGIVPGQRFYFTNDRGDYLLDSATGLGFGFDTGRPAHIQEHFPALAGFFGGDERAGWFDLAAARGSDGPSRLYARKLFFDPLRPERFLAVGYSASAESLFGASWMVGRDAVALALGLTAVGSCFVFFCVRRSLRPLGAIVESADSIAEGRYDVDLPPDSPDEVGHLARSIRLMIAEVEARSERIREQQAELSAANARLELAKREVEERAEEVRQLSAYRAQFLARVSHDLRTPLNSMLILARSLAENERGHLDDDEVESARILASSGGDLLDLLNDLLDLSRAEAGKLDVLEERANLPELLERVRSQFAALAGAKKVELRLTIDQDLRWIVADPRRLRQVLWNLVSNALKFTDQGWVAIRARVCNPPEGLSTPSGKNWLELCVEDTGPGMDATQIEHICSPYKNLERHVRSGQAGTGLGLAVVREIASALGGDLKVRSEVGRGSRFCVRTPVGADARVRQPALLAARREATGHARVLIADDDEAVRWILTRALRDLDASVEIEEAETARESIEALAASAFHSAVVDYHLPGMTGLDVLQRLRAAPGHLLPRLFLYTGRTLTHDEQEQVEALGAEAVEKSADSQALKAFARRLLDGRAEEPQLDGLSLLLAEDDKASLFALKRELSRYGAAVVEASNGYEALLKLRGNSGVRAVVMDMRMPVLDGYEAIRRLRADPLHHSLPVLAVTADATEEDRRMCLAVGATDFLTKPVDPRRLAGRIASLTRGA